MKRYITLGIWLALPNISYAVCGDGFIDEDEECDDLDLDDGDGCSSLCLLEEGWECAGSSFTLDFYEILNNMGHDDPQWSISADHLTVTQPINANPSIFMSTLPTLNVPITFELTVNSSSDDDYIGWVVGYDAGEYASSSAYWLLFDWKRGDQTWEGHDGYAGLRMYIVNSPISDAYSLWGHDSGMIEIASANTLGSVGWDHYTTYTIELNYTYDQIVVYVNGVLEFQESGSFPKGNFGFYTFSQPGIEYTLLSPINQSLCNPLDTDEDGLTDPAEILLGTDKTNPDSDGDGLLDGDEILSPYDPADTDADGLIDPLDSDDDGDGIETQNEDIDGDGDPRNDDTDGDEIPNYLDDDDDEDNILTRLEDIDGDGDPRNDDTDGDEIPNYLDTDSDNDGIEDLLDNCTEAPNTEQADLDSDGIGDECDMDKDGDGYFGESDCDDENPDISPEEPEIWYDGIDQNCDGNDDDQDEDGWSVDEDCDDLNDEVWPAAEGWTVDCEEISDITNLEETELKIAGSCSSLASPSNPLWLWPIGGLLLLRPRRRR